MTWNAWPPSLQKQRSLRTLCCDFRFQAYRQEASASARCKATSVQTRRNYSMAGPPGSRALRGAELAGIHIYSGGQIQSAEKLAGTFEHAIHLAEQIVQAGVPLRLLDLGGGFPWPFGTSGPPIDISALREKLQRVNTQRRLTADAELWFESGRYLVASCGTLLSTVLDVKVAHRRQDPRHPRYRNGSSGRNGGPRPDLSRCCLDRAAGGA